MGRRGPKAVRVKPVVASGAGAAGPEDPGTSSVWKELGIQTYGLPPSVFVPIAAASVEAIESYVGQVQDQIKGRDGRVNAVLVDADRPDLDQQVPLWREPEAEQHADRLHPDRQVWVHVDYAGYRGAWTRLGMPDLGPGTFLDHIQNREAIRLRDHSHPYLRLCPISPQVNTNSGVDSGPEGMEKECLRHPEVRSPQAALDYERGCRVPIVLADPVDLTKMLDIAPGTWVLRGVGENIKRYYMPEAP